MDSAYVAKTARSRELYERAKRVLPAGVSYFLRYFEPYPFYTAKAKGSKLYDVDGNVYVDFWMGHYAHILGHSPPQIVKAVCEQIENGTHYGTCHELEIALAEQVVKLVPNIELVRFSNSGTEAIMYAVRLARAFTGKEKIVKFEGGWHGGYDGLHTAVKHPFNLPESNGITNGALKDTLVAPYNDLEETRRKIEKENVAAVIIEPVMGSGGCIPAELEFLKGLKEICQRNGILLIFDEIITGFRLAPGGAQEYFRINADIVVFGKILGGGFPIGAFAGRREIMEHLNPLIYERPKFSFHGGTFCGNPVTMTAGLAMLKTLEDGNIIKRLNKTGEKLRKDLTDIFERKNIDVHVTGASSLFHTHFTKEKVKDTNAAYRADRQRLQEYHEFLIRNGVFFLPTKSGAISNAHSEDDINKLLTKTEEYASLMTRK